MPTHLDPKYRLLFITLGVACGCSGAQTQTHAHKETTTPAAPTPTSDTGRIDASDDTPDEADVRASKVEGAEAMAPYPTCPVGWSEERLYPLVEYEDTDLLARNPSDWNGQTALIEFRRHGGPVQCVGWQESNESNCSYSYSSLPKQDAFSFEGVTYTHELKLELKNGTSRRKDLLAPCVYREETAEDGMMWDYVRVLGKLKVEDDGAHHVTTTLYVL